MCEDSPRESRAEDQTHLKAELRRMDPEIKAIVSSGYSNDAVIAEHHAHGFKAAVVKPFDLAELSRGLKEVIGAGREGR